MTGLLEFISGLLDGASLLAMALAIGGLMHVLAVARAPWERAALVRRHADQALRLAALAAAVLALFRGAKLLLKPVALADDTGAWDWGPFLQTQVFRFGLQSVIAALVLALGLWWLSRGPSRRGTGTGIAGASPRVRWTVVLVATGLFLLNEAWLSHAVSRVEAAGLLMTVTVVHLIGATVWAGGITHLLLFRRVRDDPEAAAWWPILVSRFSPVGIVSVALILGPGVVLASRYVGDLSGLVGTGYGNLLLVKVVLFVCVLALASVNFRAARSWHRREQAALDGRVPGFIEVEIVLASALLFAASALTSFPPSADIPNDRVAPGDMWRMFSPKVPHLAGPQAIMIDAPELTDPVTGMMGQKPDLSWDRFNHNISGVIVLVMAVLAFIDRLGRVRWARHWPLMFMVFAVLIFVFSNPTEFPLGDLGFWDSVRDAQVVQHWLAALVVLGLGWFEWRARRGGFGRWDLRYVFPILAIVGGIILLTHSHNISELWEDFLTQSTHVAMGVLAVVAGCARWLELRAPPSQDRVAGMAAAGAMFLVGLILLFYVDPGDRETWNSLP
jgi:putative copper resistance protein D